MTARLFAVVGPSGAGKDTLMRAAAAARPGEILLVRRAITRPAGKGGEIHDCLSAPEFESRKNRGEFALHWSAHGLWYGIPAGIGALAAKGAILFNCSRAVLGEAAVQFPGLTVLHVNARRDVRASRLSARGREGTDRIARRLDRKPPAFPPDLPVADIDNSGELDRAVEDFLAALDRATTP